MKPRAIGYGHLHSREDFRNEKLYIEVELEDWENVEPSYQFLREKVLSLLGSDLEDCRDRLRQELIEYNYEIHQRKLELHFLKEKAEKILESTELIDKVRCLKPQEYGSFKEKLHSLIDSINTLFMESQSKSTSDLNSEAEAEVIVLNLFDERCDDSNAIPL